MNLLIKRIAKRDNYTIGKLYIDGVYFCDTLEDKDRGLTQSMQLSQISKIKIYGSTAIPTGKYLITITYSNRFKQLMPLLNNVPGFSGIRIHVGNAHKDTEGCILVGKNKVVGKVLESKDTYKKLYQILSKANNKEQIYITIQ